MNLPSFSYVLLQALLFALLHRHTLALKKHYIVCLGAHSHDVEPKFVDVDRVENSHHEFLGSFLGSKIESKRRIHYSYAMHVNAFTAVLEEDEAAELAKHPDVISVSENEASYKPRTTRSWEFLGLERNGEIPVDSIWNKARFGQDIIIANLDLGVWPESKSFSDEGMGPVPSKWQGICQFSTENGTSGCNRKLIGARYFSKGYLVKCNLTEGCIPNPAYDTPRDYHGHGTHTLSTAGGSFVPGANVFGHGYGTAKGGSPKARVAAYKICGAQKEGENCFESDMLAGLDAAIADGVDVVSLSIGDDILVARELCYDWMAIATFHAVKRGIVVVAAGGNEGPNPRTITNVAPWMITVGGSTIDRRFASYVVLGNNKTLFGTSLSSTYLKDKMQYPLITGVEATANDGDPDQAYNCLVDHLDPKKIKGKILVCRGIDSIPELDLLQLGVVGMIRVKQDVRIAQPVGLHFLPTSEISHPDVDVLIAYMNSTNNSTAYISPVKTELGVKPAPIVLPLSSRGPNSFHPTILKPDIIAPGENIIAAFTEHLGASMEQLDPRRVPFSVLSGTSMACPHVAGIVGLLKAIHPNWSPAAIKSAIMTTGKTKFDMVPILEANQTEATPFAYGAGLVDANRAMDPGLVYDLTVDDYLNFLCTLGYNQSILKVFFDKDYVCSKSFKLANFNYPSITVPDLGKSLTITRKVKNVGSPGTYKAYIRAPTGILVSVKPSSLTFKKRGQEKKFKLILKPLGNSRPTDYVFGELIWSDGQHEVKSPLVVKLRS